MVMVQLIKGKYLRLSTWLPFGAYQSSLCVKIIIMVKLTLQILIDLTGFADFISTS